MFLLLLVIGLLTPLACAAVISVMLIAGLLAHRPNGFFVFRDGYEYVLVLSVTSLALAMLGPGRLSLDSAAGSTISDWAGGGVALGVAVVATAGLLATFWRPQPKEPPWLILEFQTRKSVKYQDFRLLRPPVGSRAPFLSRMEIKPGQPTMAGR